jgi:hypothetical protein
VQIPEGVTATLCFLLESDVTLRPEQSSLLVDGVARTPALVSKDKPVNTAIIQDLSDALAVLGLEQDRKPASNAMVRFVRPEDDFQHYPAQDYYGNHWMWAITDISPGKHDVQFEALTPPLRGSANQSSKFGSWLWQQYQLAKQTRSWKKAGFVPSRQPRLYLPEEIIDRSFVVITPHQTL